MINQIYQRHLCKKKEGKSSLNTLMILIQGITKLHARLLAVPRYKELSTSKVWALVREVPELMIYFPDLEQNELPDRTFMWTILSTFREDAVKSLIEEARKSRDASK